VTPEGKVKAMLKKYLVKRAAYQFWPVQTGYGAAGVDCYACIDGQFWAIETKREGVETCTPRQMLVLKQVHAAGGIAAIVTIRDGGLHFIRVTT
jgi:hypothetical protein